MKSQEERAYRIKALLNAIQQVNDRGKIALEGKLIAHFSYEYHVGERYVKEYLKILELSEKIIRHQGNIWTKEAYDKINLELPSDVEKSQESADGGKK